MPTMPGREGFRLGAIECYESQTYPLRELVIVEDEGTVGAKRNLACSRVKGEIICHWDDDDWSQPERIQDQVERLSASGKQITGYHSMLFLDESGCWWKYKGHEGYALGTSLCYFKDFWRKRPFQDLKWSEDNAFIKGIEVASVDAEEMMWARIHSGNTSEKMSKLSCANWEKIG
jgi:glycosyltransferase involved in cell wall biosynthesis